MGFALTVRRTFGTDGLIQCWRICGRLTRVSATAFSDTLPLPLKATTVRPKELHGFGRNRLWARGVHAIIEPSRRPAERRAAREDSFDANGLPWI